MYFFLKKNIMISASTEYSKFFCILTLSFQEYMNSYIKRKKRGGEEC